MVREQSTADRNVAFPVSSFQLKADDEPLSVMIEPTAYEITVPPQEHLTLTFRGGPLKFELRFGDNWFSVWPHPGTQVWAQVSNEAAPVEVFGYGPPGPPDEVWPPTVTDWAHLRDLES